MLREPIGNYNNETCDVRILKITHEGWSVMQIQQQYHKSANLEIDGIPGRDNGIAANFIANQSNIHCSYLSLLVHRTATENQSAIQMWLR